MTLKVLYPIDETMSNATRILMLGFLLSPRAWQNDMKSINYNGIKLFVEAYHVFSVMEDKTYIEVRTSPFKIKTSSTYLDGVEYGIELMHITEKALKFIKSHLKLKDGRYLIRTDPDQYLTGIWC